MTKINFSPINLNKLPAPNVIESLDYESIRTQMLDDYLIRFPEANNELLSDPVVKLIETFAYRELLLRQRVNDGAHAVLLATASGSELDHLGDRFNVQRQLIREGDLNANPIIKAEYESDSRYRERIQLSLEGFSTAGPIGAYVFHALKASPHVKDVTVDAPEFTYANLSPELIAQLPEDVLVLKCTYDAGLTAPQPGDVSITTLSTQGSGADPELAETVIAALSADDIRPLTDHVRNREVDIIEYTLNANLFFHQGTDEQKTQQDAIDAVSNYIHQHHKLGVAVTQSGLFSALHQPGVERVELITPTKDIFPESFQAAFCTQISVTIGNSYDNK